MSPPLGSHPNPADADLALDLELGSREMNVIPIVLYLLPDLWPLLPNPIAKTKSINSKFPLELVKGSTGHSKDLLFNKILDGLDQG